jgi:hypothetical protein
LAPPQFRSIAHGIGDSAPATLNSCQAFAAREAPAALLLKSIGSLARPHTLSVCLHAVCAKADRMRRPLFAPGSGANAAGWPNALTGTQPETFDRQHSLLTAAHGELASRLWKFRALEPIGGHFRGLKFRLTTPA